jgi:serine/tyrosine/threonine adenylyltransferase
VIETGEELWRGDEPSPTRSAVLVRLSHGHVRIGTFQRLRALELHDEMAALVAYCLETFPGPLPPDDAPGRDEPAVILLHQVVERMADLAASYMVAGFVHGVLNSDNMNISGESFDYGPWRWLPRWDPAFTAAYFDHSGLYCFGRQPEAIHWNCGQLAIALRMLTETEPLVFALERFTGLFQAAMLRRFLWRLGVASRREDADFALVGAAEQHMHDTGISPDAFFATHRGGRNPPDSEFGALLAAFTPVGDNADGIGGETGGTHLLIDEVERIWSAIDETDDWTPLAAKIAEIRRLGAALGPAPPPAGQAAPSGS